MKKKSCRALYIISAFAIILIIIHLTLPYALKTYVNKKLSEPSEYQGSVGDIDLHLYRGAYKIQDVVINKVSGNVPTPFFTARTIDISIAWRALFNGALVAEFVVQSPELNIVDSNNQASTQTVSSAGTWQEAINALAPIRIDRFKVRNGQLHFRNFNSKPAVDVYLNAINIEAKNLTNSRDISDTLAATITGNALAMNDADLDFVLKIDPYQAQPTFDMDVRLQRLPLSTIDDLIRAYAPFDLEAGTLSVAAEVAASKGTLTGYIKPVFQNLEVFSWKGDVQEDKDNPFRVLWESVVGMFSEILENQPKDQIATRIQIDGKFENPDIDVLSAIGGILRNAFIEAYQAQIEGSVSLDDAKEEQQ